MGHEKCEILAAFMSTRHECQSVDISFERTTGNVEGRKELGK